MGAVWATLSGKSTRLQHPTSSELSAPPAPTIPTRRCILFPPPSGFFAISPTLLNPNPNANIKLTAKRARSEQQPACVSGADANTDGRSTQPEATATVEPAAKRRRRCEPAETDMDERGQLDFIRSLVPGVSIVWAKYSKYPFWPGKVIAADVTGVRVVFFGDQTEERISNMAFVQPFPGSAAMHEQFKQQALLAATNPEAFLAGFAQATADHEEFLLQHQTEQVGLGCSLPCNMFPLPHAQSCLK